MVRKVYMRGEIDSAFESMGRLIGGMKEEMHTGRSAETGGGVPSSESEELKESSDAMENPDDERDE